MERGVTLEKKFMKKERGKHKPLNPKGKERTLVKAGERG